MKKILVVWDVPERIDEKGFVRRPVKGAVLRCSMTAFV